MDLSSLEPETAGVPDDDVRPPKKMRKTPAMRNKDPETGAKVYADREAMEVDLGAAGLKLVTAPFMDDNILLGHFPSSSRRALALAVTTQLAQVCKPRAPRLYHF